LFGTLEVVIQPLLKRPAFSAALGSISISLRIEIKKLISVLLIHSWWTHRTFSTIHLVNSSHYGTSKLGRILYTGRSLHKTHHAKIQGP
jgi:hypothetical protein